MEKVDVDKLANCITQIVQNSPGSDITKDEAALARAVLDRGRRIKELEAERDNWIDTAAQFSRNQEFYHGIVTQIGERFGTAAKTSDDGSIQDGVLALKVDELVGELFTERDALKAENARLRAGYDRLFHPPEADDGSRIIKVTGKRAGEIVREARGE